MQRVHLLLRRLLDLVDVQRRAEEHGDVDAPRQWQVEAAPVEEERRLRPARERLHEAPPVEPRAEPALSMERIETPGKKSIEDVCTFLSVEPQQCIKTLIVEGTDEGLVALALHRTQLARNAFSAGSASTAAMEPVARHARLGNSHTVMQRSSGWRMLWPRHRCGRLTALTPLVLQVMAVLRVSPVQT